MADTTPPPSFHLLPEGFEVSLRHCERPMTWAYGWVEGDYPNGGESAVNSYRCLCGAHVTVKITEPARPREEP